MEEVEDFGEHLGYESHSTGNWGKHEMDTNRTEER